MSTHHVAAATVPPGLQSLVDALGDFSSAEILLALMLAAATNNDKDEECGSAVAGFLVGLALGAQIGQSMNGTLGAMAPGPGIGIDAGVGLNLNVTA